MPSWRDPYERAPGEVVYGDTTTGGGNYHGKSLRIIAENQKWLAGDTAGTFNEDTSPIFYQNRATRQNTGRWVPAELGGGSGYVDLFFVRTFDELAYSGRNLRLVWGNYSDEKNQNSQILEDCGPTGYRVIDLNACPLLSVGTLYWLETTLEEGTPENPVDRRSIYWAVEWPGMAREPVLTAHSGEEISLAEELKEEDL